MGQAPIHRSCADIGCACSKSAYEGAAGAGFFRGVMGMVGAGGFFDTTNQAPLKQAQKELASVKSYWSQVVGCLQQSIDYDYKSEIKDEFNLLQSRQEEVNQTLEFEVKRNTILIVMLIVIVFLLLVYDISIPLPHK